MDYTQRVYQIVSHIPKGKVLTYRLVAKFSRIKSPRVVGNILHKNKDPQKIPCYRVVHKDGSLATNYKFGGIKIQEEKLRSEGIEIFKGKVNLENRLWKPNF